MQIIMFFHNLSNHIFSFCILLVKEIEIQYFSWKQRRNWKETEWKTYDDRVCEKHSIKSYWTAHMILDNVKLIDKFERQNLVLFWKNSKDRNESTDNQRKGQIPTVQKVEKFRKRRRIKQNYTLSHNTKHSI